MTEDPHASLSPPSPRRQSIEDPGAHELESDSDDHFSDARSDRDSTSRVPSRAASPIPITRVERVDHEASYGEVPGTEAYDKRAEDARPDEVAFIEEEQKPDVSPSPITSPATPSGQTVPKTVLEEAPPSPILASSHRNSIHKSHPADPLPDLILHIPEAESASSAAASPGGLPIPSTRVEKVDSVPSYGEIPGTDAYEKRGADAVPDSVEEVGDLSGSPTSSAARSSSISSHEQESPAEASRLADDYNEEEDGDSAGFGDDFDDFEEGDEDAEFGDFDDGFQAADSAPAAPVPSLPQIVPSLPVLDFDDLDSPNEVLSATRPYIDALFPPDTIDTSALPSTTPENPTFLTQRSASLWSQLVAPPPLQPPNWIRSRIRRLFLVSLGVPVDLDEILPASKQKKLILPSINLSSGRTSTDSRAVGSVSRLKASDGNASNTSVDSQGKPSASRRRKGPPPSPELDLVYARQLCTVTDEALAGLTVDELKEHVAKLEAMQGRAREVLEYWTKRTDEKLGDREAFEGVIENLVQHARKVRK